MPTVDIELTEHEFVELKAATQQLDATAAVRSAVIEYLRLTRRMQLKRLPGQLSIEENWQALEAVELGNNMAVRDLLLIDACFGPRFSTAHLELPPRSYAVEEYKTPQLRHS